MTLAAKTAKHQTPMDAFLERKAEVDALLAKLTEASSNHFDWDPDAINWGHAGNLGQVIKQLREVTEFLGIK